MRGRSAFLGIGILLLAASAAQAGPATQRTAFEDPRQAPVANALATPSAESSWFRTHLHRIRVHKKTGFAYTKNFDAIDHDFSLSVRGPAMGRKRYGLSFELRF